MMRTVRCRNFVNLDECRLIDEVKKYPVLYDKNADGANKPFKRNEMWGRVASAMDSSIDECKKRWKSLRDTFLKQHKVLLLEPIGPGKRKKWHLYNEMEFLSKYIDRSNFSYYIGSNYDDSIIETKKYEPIKMVKSEDESTLQDEEEEEIEQETAEEDIADYEATEYFEINLNQENATPSLVRVQENHNPKPFSTKSIFKKEAAKPTCSMVPDDPDDRFLLSCGPILRRLSNKKNSLARIKIQQLLYDIEFCSDDEN